MKLLLVVILLALMIYATIRAIQRRGVQPSKRSTGLGRPSKDRPPARPFGPDDDPDFLRDLDRRRKHPDDPEGRPPS